MTDTLWNSIKLFLVMGGTFFAARGWWSEASVVPAVDKIIEFAGAAVALGAAGWTLWVYFRTKAVPIVIVEERDIPFADPVTGIVKKPSDR